MTPTNLRIEVGEKSVLKLTPVQNTEYRKHRIYKIIVYLKVGNVGFMYSMNFKWKKKS